jgi:hypothetical protein
MSNPSLPFVSPPARLYSKEDLELTEILLDRSWSRDSFAPETSPPHRTTLQQAEGY